MKAWRYHFTRSHREFAMLDLTQAADMTIDRHVVGRVRETDSALPPLRNSS